MRWLADGWPVIGVPSDDPACGEPCLTHVKPKTYRPSAPLSLRASANFCSPELGRSGSSWANGTSPFMRWTQKRRFTPVLRASDRGQAAVAMACLPDACGRRWCAPPSPPP
jgi:hypothetical protein